MVKFLEGTYYTLFSLQRFHWIVCVILFNIPSLITSRHQKDIDRTRDKKAVIKNWDELPKPCIVKTPLVVKANNDIQQYNGQGDGDTKWNGWDWKLLLIKFVIIKIFLMDSLVWLYL